MLELFHEKNSEYISHSALVPSKISKANISPKFSLGILVFDFGYSVEFT
jgi:hypothetical protein